eukprot:365881-Chlamydomonas_euryale.AAC.5
MERWVFEGGRLVCRPGWHVGGTSVVRRRHGTQAAPPEAGHWRAAPREVSREYWASIGGCLIAVPRWERHTSMGLA